MMHVRRLRVFWVLTVVLLLLLVVVALKSFDNYRVLKDHRSTLFSSDRVVESWMTPLMLERHFGISLKDSFDVLGVPFSSRNRRLPFDDLCLMYNLDCRVVLEGLNSLR